MLPMQSCTCRFLNRPLLSQTSCTRAHLTCDHGWDGTSWRGVAAREGAASSAAGTALWAAAKSARHFLGSKEVYSKDYFVSISPWFFSSLLFLRCVFFFPFPFLFPVSLCLLCAHCSAAPPLCTFPSSPHCTVSHFLFLGPFCFIHWPLLWFLLFPLFSHPHLVPVRCCFLFAKLLCSSSICFQIHFSCLHTEKY